MRLSPRDTDKLMLHQAGFLAQKRYARGVRLNHPETVALIATQLLEFIRDGEPVSALMNKGKQLLGFDDVMPGVAETVHEVQVEGTFPDGTKLVTVHDPVCREQGDPALVLYGSGLSRRVEPGAAAVSCLPGERKFSRDKIELNAGRETVQIEVTNHGDRPVQVGSHYPFFETNAGLVFDRKKAFGMRLDIAAGTAVRFEPGESKKVQLVRIAGEEIIFGGNAITSGSAKPEEADAALARALERNFSHQEDLS
ncbi:urease subunit beta [Kiritimatiellaeota bacterium B1221]|nr:urease subunit beta [Kiritimatiellaeota bacterium B1221]